MYIKILKTFYFAGLTIDFFILLDNFLSKQLILVFYTSKKRNIVKLPMFGKT